MIRIAFCNVGDLDLAKSYELLPGNRKEKFDNFLFDKDKRLSAGAYLLLEKLLEEESVTQPTFKIGEYGKAYISNHKDIHFNLSHSKNMVACAISDKEVGVDIEYIDPAIDLNIAKHYFYNSEYENIMNSKNPPDEFFKYWVLKESYMKYTGLGFQLALNSFEIIVDDEIKLKDDENNLKFNQFNLKDYKLATCCRYHTSKLEEYFSHELLI